MKALVKTGYGKGLLELVEKPIPEIKPDEMLVKVVAAGICGSDIHIEDGEYTHTPNLPIGHELVGEVVKIGSEVTGWEIGDRVLPFSAQRSCGKCEYCKQGLYLLCKGKQGLGFEVSGGMAEYAVVVADRCFKVPEERKNELYWAMTEPAACCVRATMEMADVHAGDTALVVGPGPMGLLCVQLLIAEGARVVVSGTKKDAPRLELAKKYGAVAVCDDASQLDDIIYGLDPEGVDFTVECAGLAVTYDMCFKYLKRRGQLIQVGLMGKPIPIMPDTWLDKEITITGNHASEPSSWKRVIELVMAGKLDLESLVGAKLPLTEWQEGFRLHRNHESLKVLLIP